MTSGDWLPAQAPFDLVRRGYSPEQVTAHLERLEYDLRITTANRDATNQRLNELGGQLAAAQAEADTLRNQLDRSALEPVSMANLSDRMQRMIRLAEEEASEIRARAEADADKLRGQLETSLGDATAARAAFDAERERTRKQLAEQVHGLIAEATAEAQETTALAQRESAQVRQEANAEAENTIAEANRIAELTLAESAAAAATLAQETAAEREQLDADSLAHRTQVDEDFEIAITARRAEAHKVITDREEASAAMAATLVADAKAEAERLVANATAESQTLMQQATTYSNALVNRAAMESHQRVADADDAVLALHTLRGQLTDQLTSLSGHLEHIRDLAASAPTLIDPPEAEAGRPLTGHFPLDPAGRPTLTDVPLPVLEGSPDASPEVGEPPAEGEDDPAAPLDLEPAEADPADGEPAVDGNADADQPADAEPQTVAAGSSQRTRFRGGRGH